MRPVERGPWPTHGANATRYIFNDWKNASSHLKDRTGDYCHFCEMRVNHMLAIEHIFPKVKFSRIKSSWENFLLICSSCNSSKLHEVPRRPYRNVYYWPHLNNTLLAFSCDLTKFTVCARPNIGAGQAIRANATIDLYGLDKIITSDGAADNRFIERMKAADSAMALYEEYSRQEATVGAIVRAATVHGFFTLWLEVFHDVPAVLDALYRAPDFKLASVACFHPNYISQPRNPGMVDPF